MPFKQEDWAKAQPRLTAARELYLTYKRQASGARDRDLLDDAILKAWTFGEYAINACLEKVKTAAVQDHSQPSQARLLFDAKHLSQDYFNPLEKLERFRKKASHLGYVKEASTHYSSADVDRCLTAMEALNAEVEALLAKGHPKP